MVKFSAFREDEEESVPDWERMRASKRSRVTETSSIQQTEVEERGSKEGIVEGVDESTIGVSSKAVSVILSDPDVLDCSICFEPLTIPVFQCENGHTACHSCSVKLKNKCPSCSEKIGHNRCRAIEKVIESIKIRCCYVNYGCKEVVSYSMKHFHEEMCFYAPCLCPFQNCTFRSTTTRMSSHVSQEHSNFVIHFRYNSIFPVSTGLDDKFIVLLEKNDGVLFILQIGTSLIVKCLEPSPEKGKFAYEIMIQSGNTSLKFQSFTFGTKGLTSVPPTTDFLPIPDYFRCGGHLEFELCIRSKDASGARI